MMCVAQVMPIAKATLYTIKGVNGLAGIAQCFLPGTAAGQKCANGLPRLRERARMHGALCALSPHV